MQTLIAAIHGILTSQTQASWPDKFDAWMFQRDPQVKVLKKEYRAGPFPHWNCFIKDPLLARGLVKEIRLFLQPPRSETSAPGGSVGPSIWLVAHSNGAIIALHTAKTLTEGNCKVAGLILLGAACEADIARNGILEWHCRGMLGAAIAYSSADDRVLNGFSHTELQQKGSFAGFVSSVRAGLRGKALWPYGFLGRTGWLLDGRAVGSAPEISSARLFTRWFADGHCAYFEPQRIKRTFEQIYQDIRGEKERLKAKG